MTRLDSNRGALQQFQNSRGQPNTQTMQTLLPDKDDILQKINYDIHEDVREIEISDDESDESDASDLIDLRSNLSF
jgi:hypothetical protein